MSEPTKAVFLSYASQDAPAVERIAEALRAAGVEVWFDQSELVGGDAWDQKIRRQIKECALFVPVISANTQARAEGYFRLEWRLADQRTHLMGKSKTFLLPVCIDGTPDAEADVPDSFLAAQWVRLPAGDATPAFCERVQVLLGGPLRKEVRPPPVRRSDSVAAMPAVAEKSVAVLAFANLSRDVDNEYFSDGISEELLNVLAKIPALRVTARTSSFHFKGRNMPVPEIAQKLGVRYVVEGSVRKAGSRVRITAQLIDAQDGFHLWSDSFDRELRDIFAVQDEVAAVIAKNLQLKLDPPSRARVVVNPEAYRLVLEGRHYALGGSNENLQRAEELLSKALTLDPEFASALAGLAFVWHMRARLSMVAPQRVAFQLTQAETNARRALAADSSLGEPVIMLGSVALLRGELADAQACLERGLALSPSSDAGRSINGFLLLRLGRPDLALVEMAAARQLNPLAGGLIDAWGLALAGLQRYDEAADAFERAALLWPMPVAHANHALALANLGRNAGAIERARIALDPAVKHGWPEGFNSLSDGLAAWALAKAGARNEAAAAVGRILAGPADRRFNAGFALALLDRTEEALIQWRGLPQFVIFYLLAFISENPAVRDDPRTGELLVHLKAEEALKNRERVLREGAVRP